jgi:uncharacterized protein (DUF58 family)
MLNLYFNNRTFFLLGFIVLVFCAGLVVPVLFPVAKVLLLFLAMAVVVETVLLFGKKELLDFNRGLPSKLSNGDAHQIRLNYQNFSPFALNLEIYDELPYQFQKHEFKLKHQICRDESESFQYEVKPRMRGVYTWQSNVVLAGLRFPGLVSRKVTFEAEETINCYPSFDQFKKLPVSGLVSQFSQADGSAIRKIGQSLEFEQIKNYGIGDDFRHINWKASARRGKMMVNQYQDEKSQEIYCVLDLGRSMKLPFEEQTLLDYSINAALGLSKVILDIKDKAGLITFSAEECRILPAKSDMRQFKKINDILYNIDSKFSESDYERLYKFVRNKVPSRCLLIIFTQFDTLQQMTRVLNYLKGLSRYHLVLLITFENDDVKNYIEKPAADVNEVYSKTISRGFWMQNQAIGKELAKYGILSMVCSPHRLTIDLINDYLKIKRKQMI